MRRRKHWLPPIPPVTRDPFEVACAIVLIVAAVVFFVHWRAPWR